MKTLVFTSPTQREIERRALLNVSKSYGARGRRRNLMRLVMEQGKHCYYCEREVFLPWMVSKKYRRANIDLMATFDHRIPSSQGGTYALHNGILSCQLCNNERGRRDPEEFKAFVEKHGNKTERDGARAVRRQKRKEARNEKRRPKQLLALFDLATLFHVLRQQRKEKYGS